MTQAAATRLTLLHRAEQVRLGREAVQEMARLWPLLDVRDLAASEQQWAAAVLSTLLEMRRQSAATAATYLDGWASTQGAVVTTPPEDEPASVEAAATTSLHVLGPVLLRRLIPTRGLEWATRTALTALSGATTRHVLDGARSQTMRTITASPDLAGWRRVIRADACDWCVMLAGRGAVYSADTADFGAHDHCSCMAEPALGGRRIDVRQYTPGQRRSTTDQARAKEWVAENRAAALAGAVVA